MTRNTVPRAWGPQPMSRWSTVSLGTTAYVQVEHCPLSLGPQPMSRWSTVPGAWDHSLPSRWSTILQGWGPQPMSRWSTVSLGTTAYVQVEPCPPRLGPQPMSSCPPRLGPQTVSHSIQLQ
ncbi:hypothetical protein ACRRTK_024697 [Alexandromys fortis]